MKIHHFDSFYKFYLGSEDRTDIEDKAKKGIGLPANSTLKVPPLNECKGDEIPIFKNDYWKIVKDEFWKPSLKEVNYDAGRTMSTFKCTESDYSSFIGFPSMPQLCNTNLVATRIHQTLLIINKKFQECIKLHKRITEELTLNTIHSSVSNVNPSSLYEFKMEMESIVFLMRRVLDSLIQLTDLMVNFSKFERNKKINFESIGSLFSGKKSNSEVRFIILGNNTYPKDTTNFLEVSNNLFNGYKHSLMNDELFNEIGQDFPTFVGYSVEYSNYKKEIFFHNHNGYHFMMGFQDSVSRILRNQKLYRENKLN